MSTIRTLFEIITFKAKPSDIPFNTNATILAFTLAWLTTYINASLQSNAQSDLLPTIPNLLIFTLVQVGMYGAMIAFFLKINKKKNRIYQTLLASYGALAIIDTIALFLFFIGLPILVISVKAWGLITQIFILKNSHDINSGQAFLMLMAIYLTVAFFLAFTYVVAFPEYVKELLDTMEKLKSQPQ